MHPSGEGSGLGKVRLPNLQPETVPNAANAVTMEAAVVSAINSHIRHLGHSTFAVTVFAVAV